MTTARESIGQRFYDEDRGIHNPVTETKAEKSNRLWKQHPGTRRQVSSHGAGKMSVQFFDKTTGKLVADYNLWPFPPGLPRGPDDDGQTKQGEGKMTQVKGPNAESQEIKSLVIGILKHDDARNYTDFESIAESVLSEVESKRDLTGDQSQLVNELVEEWWQQWHEDEDDDETNHELERDER